MKPMTMRSHTILVAALLGLLAISVSAVSAGPGDKEMSWYTIDGGGIGPSNPSSGGSYTLSGTIGQPDARNYPEPMTGGSYSLTGGFWVIPECTAHPVDYDNDCDVDLGDFAHFEACFSGPTVAYSGDCNDTDFDTDSDVDQKDFGIFQRCYSGEGNPADPDCAN